MIKTQEQAQHLLAELESLEENYAEQDDDDEALERAEMAGKAAVWVDSLEVFPSAIPEQHQFIISIAIEQLEESRWASQRDDGVYWAH